MTTDLIRRSELYIDGRWTAPGAGAGRPVEVIDATTGGVLGTVPDATPADVDRAVEAARRAFPGWADTPVDERADAIDRLREALAARQAQVSRLISLEVGTPEPISTRVQAGLPLATLEAFAAAARTMEWERPLGRSTVIREPAGVVAAITPWNYPLHQLVGKVGGALAAGCTVVAKPASIAPLSAFLLAEAIAEAGFPPGVFNLVTGDGVLLGEALTAHPGVDLVSFTGSTAVGARVAALAAGNITRVRLELGGKSASVLLDDADFEQAVRSGVGNAFLNSGQTCSACTRMIVPRARMAEACEIALAAVERLTLGHPLEAGTRLGPLASAGQQRRVREYITLGMAEAKLLVGGPKQPDGLDRGFYVLPTVFGDVENSSRIAQEEIFGPVLAIIAHDGDDDAVRLANDSPYGLSGAVWSADEEHAMSIARRIRTGQVDVNRAQFNPAAPFGGYKKSGIGREFGAIGIEDFTEVKAVQR